MDQGGEHPRHREGRERTYPVFWVNRLDDIEILPHAAKKTAINSPVTPSQLAWLYRVKTIAENMVVPKFNPDRLRLSLSRLKELMIAREEARQASRVLIEAGVRFVIVETLASAKMDGVCLWLGDAAPVIALSLRMTGSTISGSC